MVRPLCSRLEHLGGRSVGAARQWGRWGQGVGAVVGEGKGGAMAREEIENDWRTKGEGRKRT